MSRTFSAALFGVLLLIGCSSSNSPAASEPASASDPSESESETPPPEEDSKTTPPPSGPCSPKDVSRFDPPWKLPAPRQHVCTDEQLEAIAPCALGYGTDEQCDRFLTGPKADRACAACVATKDSDPQWGPTVHVGKRLFLNDGGCVALLDASNKECAKSMQAAKDCVNAACLDDCFEGSKTSNADQTACAEGASSGGCKPYVDDDIACRKSLGEVHAMTACLVDFDEIGFQSLARVFCGD